MNLSRYTKTFTALVTGAIGFATAVVNSPRADISASEWIFGAVTLFMALGVYALPNTGPSTEPAE